MLNLATKLLHLFPPEMAHDLAIMGLRMTNGIQPPMVDELLQQTVMGKVFSHPVGLAAGFDKDARVFQKIGQLGFSFVEVGSVTPKPQPGNSKPRLFRLADHQAIINSYGFNSRGMDYVAERFINNPTKIITGINLGKNKDSIDYIQDFSAVAEKLLPYADYLTVNVSSPNTLGLRDLQAPGQLEPLIKQLLYLKKVVSQAVHY
jgi:dihydroorotate dehydrogenase